MQRDGERSPDGPEPPVQPELADDQHARQRTLGYLAGRTQDAQENRQIQRRARLGQVRGGEVHGDPETG